MAFDVGQAWRHLERVTDVELDGVEASVKAAEVGAAYRVNAGTREAGHGTRKIVGAVPASRPIPASRPAEVSGLFRPLWERSQPCGSLTEKNPPNWRQSTHLFPQF